MPFIRYNRDKRGFETTLVMHAYRTPQGSQQSRVLYLFRSPSNLQIGRKALEEEVVEALEHTHPDLAFDWPGLLRDRVEIRSEPRQKPRRQPDGGSRAGGGRRREREPAAPAAAAPVIDDQSLLGQTLGPAEAARLRQKYADLVQRIARRARTPEDRNRLTDRAGRLNPDEWADEAAIRAGAAAADAGLDAIAGELPQRRRGRRGGRRRPAEGDAPPDASAIMEERGATDAGNDQQVAGADRNPDAGGDGRRVGADTGAPEPGPDDIPG